MLTDTKRWDSLPCTLEEISRIGGNVRERLSADMMLLIGQSARPPCAARPSPTGSQTTPAR